MNAGNNIQIANGHDADTDIFLYTGHLFVHITGEGGYFWCKAAFDAQAVGGLQRHGSHLHEAETFIFQIHDWNGFTFGQRMLFRKDGVITLCSEGDILDGVRQFEFGRVQQEIEFRNGSTLPDPDLGKEAERDLGIDRAEIPDTIQKMAAVGIEGDRNSAAGDRAVAVGGDAVHHGEDLLDFGKHIDALLVQFD